MTRVLRGLDVAETAAAVLATLLFVAMTLVICAEVLLRYAFRAPIPWVVELSEYSLLWITFLGAAWVLRSGGHVRVDILLQHLGPRGLRVCGLVSAFLGAFATLVIFYFGVLATWTAYLRGSYKPTGIDVPTWIVLVFIPIGSLLLFSRFLRLFLEYASGRRHSETEAHFGMD